MNEAAQTLRPAEQLLEFWFSETFARRWFRSSKKFDDELRERFGVLVEAALRNELSHWLETARGTLALVILLDQLPLNIYRGKAKSFAGEAGARHAANVAIDSGWDQQLSQQEKAFLYMPFMHSESLIDQERAVSLFESAGLDGNLRWAKHHREIVQRFGRFPHRNEILGRPSSKEELEWLASDQAFHG